MPSQVAAIFVSLCLLVGLITLLVLHFIDMQEVKFHHVISRTDLASQNSSQRTNILQTVGTNRQMFPVADLGNAKNRGPDVKLILIAYMRGGSTFTADLFNHHPQVFYFYEPLRPIDFRFLRKQETAIFFHREHVLPSRKAKTYIPMLTANVLTAILGCNFESMYLAPLGERLLSKSRTTRAYRECVLQNPGVLGLHRCLPFLYETCYPAKVTMVKVVRLPMSQAKTFLEDDPKVKVIHLVRDPRAILRSREKSGIAKRYRQDNQAFCDYVTADLKTSMALKKRFPGRVLTARYEDIAGNPLHFAARMLGFAGLALTAELRGYVWNITSSRGNFSTSKWGTSRPDSRSAARAWRRDIDFAAVEEMNEDCRGLLRLAGYLPLPSEEALRDLRVPYYEEDYTRVPVGVWDV